MSAPKLCIDCRFYAPFGRGEHWCIKEISTTSLVDGSVWLRVLGHPEGQRDSTDPTDCGPGAQYWEPKP